MNIIVTTHDAPNGAFVVTFRSGNNQADVYIQKDNVVRVSFEFSPDPLFYHVVSLYAKGAAIEFTARLES